MVLDPSIVDEFSAAIQRTGDAVATQYSTTVPQLLDYAITGVRIEGAVNLLLWLLVNISMVFAYRKFYAQAEALQLVKEWLKTGIMTVMAVGLLITNVSLFDEIRWSAIAIFAPEYTLIKLVGQEAVTQMKSRPAAQAVHTQ